MILYNIYYFVTMFIYLLLDHLSLDANLFVLRIEEEIKRFKLNFENRELKKSYFKLSNDLDQSYGMKNQELETLKLWFLRSIQNTQVIHQGNFVDAAEYIAHKAIDRERIPPYRPLHPHLVWFLCNFEREVLREIFGEFFCQTIRKMGISNNISSSMTQR